MANHRQVNGKVVAVCALFCILALLATFTRWVGPVEQYYLWKLDSEDETERKTAAARLADLKSTRAIQPLLEMVGRQEPRLAHKHYSARALIDIGLPAVPALFESLAKEDGHSYSPAQEILWKIGKRGIPAYYQAVEHRSPSVRCAALGLIARTGASGPQVKDAVLRGLEDSEEGVRNNAIWSLESLSLDEDAIPVLRRALRTGGRERSNADECAAALARIGEAGASVVIALCEDDDPRIRLAAIRALRFVAPALRRKAVPCLVRALSAEDAKQRIAAAGSLAVLGPVGSPALPVLTRSLSSTEGDERTSVVQAISRIGPDKESLPALLKTATDRNVDGFDRYLATRAIGKAGPMAKETVPALVEQVRELRAADDSLRCVSIEALGRIGPAASRAVPTLAAELNGPDPVSEAAITALVRIGPSAAVHLTRRLFRAVLTADRKLLSVTARGLAGFGPRAEAAVPHLLEGLATEWRTKGEVHLECARALGSIGSAAEDAVPILVEIAAEEPWDEVIEALGRIGPPAAEAVPTLVEILENDLSRAHAALALGRIGFYARDVVPTLRNALKATDLLTRSCAAQALVRFGVKEPAVMSALADALYGHHFEDREYLVALRGFPSETKQILPQLIEFLISKDPAKRMEVVRLLQDAGPVARPAVPALRAVRDHPVFGGGIRPSEYSLEEIGEAADEAVEVILAK